MSVFARCTKCGTRRDAATEGGTECADKSAHKNNIAWTAYVQPGGRRGGRLMKSFKTKDLADKQERRWLDSFDRGELVTRAKDVPLFAEVVERYKTEHVAVHNRNPENSTFYRLDMIKDWLGKYPVDIITLQQLREMQAAQSLARKWAPATTNKVFGMIHTVLEKAREWEHIEKNPAEFLVGLMEDSTTPRFLTEVEIEKLRRASTSPRLDAYILVLLHTGARPSSIEACSFDNDDVDFEHGIIWFTTYKGARNKVHRYPVPIDPQVMALLLARRETTGGAGQVFDVANIRYLAEEAIEKSGINAGKNKNRLFTIYGLKHCYASHLIMSGATLHDVATLLGHTDDKMVRKHYLHLTQEYLRNVQAKVNLTPVLEPVKLQIIG